MSYNDYPTDKMDITMAMMAHVQPNVDLPRATSGLGPGAMGPLGPGWGAAAPTVQTFLFQLAPCLSGQG